MQDPRFLPLFLHSLPDVGAVTYTRLMEHFGSAESVLSQPSSELELFLKPSALAMLENFRHHAHSCALSKKIMRDIDWLDTHADIHLLTLEDLSYPALLRHTSKAPPLLFVRGNLDSLCLPQIAIVGSRNPSVWGLENAHRFAQYLATNGFTITSGLALGIDAAAHEGALAAQGKTIAVMGTGIDKIYPTRHHSLAQKILAAGGALVSEFPLGTMAHSAHFPQRNRIISGLSCGVLVVEAALKSGSLITAKIALEQNREVFSIPGSIHNPLARGCHQLIRQGATLTETAQDIVDQLDGLLSYQRHQLSQISGAETLQKKTPALDISTQKNTSLKSMPLKTMPLETLTSEEQYLIDAMGFDAIAIDELVERTGASVGVLIAQLVNLEIKGVVQQLGADYQRVRFDQHHFDPADRFG
jgi:DNA processing protein